MLRRKANKSYDATAMQNDSANKTKNIVNLILENAMPKAITEVYFELLVTNSMLRFPVVIIQSL